MIRKTSIEAYNHLVNSGALSEKRREVYKVLYEYGPLTGSQVKKILNKTNQLSESVRNRITELVERGVVEELGTTVCEYTQRQVTMFDVTEKVQQVEVKKLTKRQRKEMALSELRKLYSTVPKDNSLLRDSLTRIASRIKGI